MKKHLKHLASFFAVISLGFLSISCEKESKTEEAVEEIGDAVEEVADEVEDATN